MDGNLGGRPLGLARVYIGLGSTLLACKAPHDPALVFETSEWSSFVAAVKGGEFPA
ncbi:DUF397 domain-containing protein [Streptomyces sp. Isolate_219]|nr:DUF397 domain-containing protein [Streptomyces sp. Isolate_219]